MTTETYAAVSPLIGTGSTDLAPLEAHARHRLTTRAFVIHDARPSHREPLTRFYEAFDTWNLAYFGGQLVEPYLMLLEPKSARAYGDTSPVSGFGGQLQIRVRPAVLTGMKGRLRSEPEYADGRLRFALDVLFHEMIHQWQMEIAGTNEDSYHGHGPSFRDKANEISDLLGLPPVRTSKARGKAKDLPSCAQWPHCVRPPDYYLGAVIDVPANGDTEGDDEEGEGDERDRLMALVDELASLANPSLARVISETLNRRRLTRADDEHGFHFLIGDVAGDLEEERLFVVYDMVRLYAGVDDEDDDA